MCLYGFINYTNIRRIKPQLKHRASISSRIYQKFVDNPLISFIYQVDDNNSNGFAYITWYMLIRFAVITMAIYQQELLWLHAKFLRRKSINHLLETDSNSHPPATSWKSFYAVLVTMYPCNFEINVWIRVYGCRITLHYKY